MMLGKRARPPMKRTTSMTEFSLGLSPSGAAAPLDPNNPFMKKPSSGDSEHSAATPRPTRRHSGDFLETASFLRACSLCKRPLIPGRDIFMYRGDTAFCSLECRQKQIKQDERKEKCSFASKKEVVVSSATGSDVPSTGETVAAV